MKNYPWLYCTLSSASQADKCLVKAPTITVGGLALHRNKVSNIVYDIESIGFDTIRYTFPDYFRRRKSSQDGQTETPNPEPAASGLFDSFLRPASEEMK